MDVRKKSIKQEKEVASSINGKTVVASGALWGSKGDVRSEEYLIECKTTQKSYYMLNKQTWSKIQKEALKDGMRIPVMCIYLEDGKHRLAIFNTKDFIEYNGYNDLTKNMMKIMCNTKSIRIYPNRNELVCFVSSSCTMDKELSLTIIPWEDFMSLIS